jgi:hypothetical protein
MSLFIFLAIFLFFVLDFSFSIELTVCYFKLEQFGLMFLACMSAGIALFLVLFFGFIVLSLFFV